MKRNYSSVIKFKKGDLVRRRAKQTNDVGVVVSVVIDGIEPPIDYVVHWQLLNSKRVELQENLVKVNVPS